VTAASFTCLLICTVLLQPGALAAETLTVRHVEGTFHEGTFHGFLALRTLEGNTLAAGDLIEATQRDRVVSRLTFHFKDGSIDDETTVFPQHLHFRLVTDHQVVFVSHTGTRVFAL
jgi:hypothetical protein